jgi:hypothetical protein
MDLDKLHIEHAALMKFKPMLDEMHADWTAFKAARSAELAKHETEQAGHGQAGMVATGAEGAKVDAAKASPSEEQRHPVLEPAKDKDAAGNAVTA